ncbi:MAG TPA: hypothetical protein VIU87_05885 [Mycobacterium sp.]
MTIPDQQTTTIEPTEEFGHPAAGAEIPPAGAEPAVRPAERTVQSADTVDPSTVAEGTAPSIDQTAVGQTAVGQTDVAAPRTEEPAERSLFADNERSGLRSRWDDVQAGFVDDPKDCVHKADGLVSEVVEQITTGFSEARSRLEAQWARGEEASTEDLRLALMRYREFFQRLLSV